jgi:hypothetical protein
MRVMSEETRVIKRFKPFVLGTCLCGCGKEINFRSTHGFLKRFEWNHGNGKGEYSHRYKGGWQVTKHGYIRIKRKGHPNANKYGSILAHRWVMSEWLGRPLTKDEDIHHIDGNKQNNLIWNLQLIRKDYHSHIDLTQNKAGRYCFLCGSRNTSEDKSQAKELVLPKIPHWYSHPITKEKWICNKCHGKIMYETKYKKNQTTEHKKGMNEIFCFLCKSKTTRKRKSRRKGIDLPDVDCWLRHPITKEEWICHKCCCKIMWDLKHRERRREKNRQRKLAAIC